LNPNTSNQGGDIQRLFRQYSENIEFNCAKQDFTGAKGATDLKDASG